MTTILNALKNIGNGAIIFWEAYLEFLCELANDENRIRAYISILAMLAFTVLCMGGGILMLICLLFIICYTPWTIKLALLVVGLIPLLIMAYAKKYKKNESDDDIW